MMLLKFNHQSVVHLPGVIQLGFVALGLRTAICSKQHPCTLFRKRKSKVITPMMADLLLQRLAYRQPKLANCGEDYLGPFNVTIRESSEKRWGFLFTCMTTRAVHLEVLSVNGYNFLCMGIEHFFARRGTPYLAWADIDTSFVGSAKELISCIEILKRHASVRLAHKAQPGNSNHPLEVCGKFSSGAPIFFSDTLRTQKLSEGMLITTFCLVEQSLNNSRLTPISPDPNDLELLTLNHFLLGQRASSFPPLDFEQISVN